jgi:hypothetical protein
MLEGDTMPLRVPNRVARAAILATVIALGAPVVAHARVPADPPYSGKTYLVTADLDARSTPGGKRVVVNALRKGWRVAIACQTSGPAAYGSTIWDKVGIYYYPDHFLKTGTDGFAPGIPRCATTPPPPPPTPNPGGRCKGAKVDDPTSTGQITHRMCVLYYAMKATGKTHSAACWDEHAWNPTSDHPLGKACDFFYAPYDKADVKLGWTMARWLIRHAKRYGIHYLIWRDQSWSIENPYWKPYKSSVYGCPKPLTPKTVTGCHYDHIHVSVT